MVLSWLLYLISNIGVRVAHKNGNANKEYQWRKTAHLQGKTFQPRRGNIAKQHPVIKIIELINETNLTRSSSNLRFKHAASMSRAKCLGITNRWEKNMGYVSFPSLFWPVLSYNESQKWGETEVIRGIGKKSTPNRSKYVCVVVFHKVACYFQYLES